MNLNHEQIQKVKEYASLFLSYEEIALLLQINSDDFIAEVTDEYSEVYKAYELGRLENEIEIRKQIIALAKLGSPAAQEQAMRLLKELQIKLSNHG